MKELLDIEVTFMTTVPKIDEQGNPVGAEQQPIKRIARFKRLDATNSDQRNIQFKILSYYSGGAVLTNKRKKNQLNIDPDFVLDVTLDFMEDMLVVDKEVFTDVDRKELMADNIAMFNLGWELFAKEVNPFFQKSMGRL